MGWMLRKYCKKLIQLDLVDFIASDTHNTKNRKPDLGDCATYLEKKYGSDYVYRLCIENPEMMLGGYETHANNLY